MRIPIRVRGSHGFVAVSAAVGVVTVLVAALLGVGNKTSVLHFLGDGAWLSDHQSSSVVHVNGSSGRADFRIPVSGGDRLEVIQREDGAYIFDPSSCQWTKIDDVGQKLNASSNPPSQAPTDCNRGLVFGDGRAYFVNGQLGSVQEVDPATLAAKGAPVLLNSKMSDVLGRIPAVVDHAGQLDAAVGPLGAVAVVANGRAQARIPFGTAGDGTEIVRTQNHVVVLDVATRGAASVEPRGTLGPKVSLPEVKADGLLVKAEIDDSDLVWGVDTTASQLVVVDTAHAAARSVPIGVAANLITRPGPPVANGAVVYVPDLASGTLYLLSAATGQQTKPPVKVAAAGSKGFDLVVKDGRVYANDPDSAQAVVFDAAGSPTFVAKEDPAVPTPHPPVTTPPPVIPPISIPPVTLPTPGPTPGPTLIPGPTPGKGSTTTTTKVPPPVAAAPGAPTALAASGGKSQISVSWLVPPANGSPIVSYAISWTGSAGDNGTAPPVAANPITAGASASYTIANLKNGEAFTVTVAATNTVGTGPSATAAPATPTNAVPDPPPSVTATADKLGNVTVSWPAPPPSGYPISTYAVYANNSQLAPSLFGSLNLATAMGFTLSNTQLGLALGTPVSFTVATVTQVNGSTVTGAQSIKSPTVAPVTAPSAPTALAEGPLSVASSAPITWKAPAITGDGGIKPITYTVTANGTPVTPNGLSATIPLAGSPVQVQVTATNTVGTSPPATITITPPTPPSFSFGGAVETWPLGGSLTLSVNVTINSAYPVASCSITLGGIGTLPCAQGNQTKQFTVTLSGGAVGVQGSVQNSLGQSVSNVIIGSAPLWGVTNSSLKSSITIPVNFRSGPGTNYGVNSRHLPPTGIPAVCQAQGTLAYFVPGDTTSPSSSQWDKMSNGDWVADIFVNPISLPLC